jgi:hypothetical protein
MLKIFDANGIELGPLLGRDDFYYAPLDRLISVATNGNPGLGRLTPKINVVFTTTDCTGRAYLAIGDIEMATNVNILLPVGPGRYYVVDRGTPAVPLIRRSSLTFDDPTQAFSCFTFSQAETINLRELREVQIPFDDPVAMPLRYRVD